jgi:hypothetical protein
VLEAAGRVVQLDGGSQAKSLSGRPKTDPLTDHLGVFSQLAGRVLMGLLRGSFVPPKADHVGLRPCPAARSMAARNPPARSPCATGVAAGSGRG